MQNWTRNQSGCWGEHKFAIWQVLITSFRSRHRKKKRPLRDCTRVSEVYLVYHKLTVCVTLLRSISPSSARTGECHKPADITWILLSFSCFTFLLSYLLYYYSCVFLFFVFTIFYRNCLYSSRTESRLLLHLSRIMKRVYRVYKQQHATRIWARNWRKSYHSTIVGAAPLFDGWSSSSSTTSPIQLKALSIRWLARINMTAQAKLCAFIIVKNSEQL